MLLQEIYKVSIRLRQRLFHRTKRKKISNIWSQYEKFYYPGAGQITLIQVVLDCDIP